MACAVLSLGCPRSPTTAHPAADAATTNAVAEPAPTAPAGLVATVLAPHPRSSGEAFAARSGLPVPMTLLLSVGVGVPMAVLGAVDLGRPAAACLFEDADGAPSWALAMTPRTAAEARAALGARYRLVPEPGVGERVASREPAGREPSLACALVTVRAAPAVRVVCAPTVAALRTAARWTAWSVRDEAGGSDVRVEVADGGLQRLRARAREGSTALFAGWAEAASAERRAHDHPPDFGDPEAALALARRVRDEVDAALGEARGVVLMMRVRDDGVGLYLALDVPGDGTSSLASDARARADVELGDAARLRGWLAPDARVVGLVNTPGGGARALWTALVDAGLSVLGARVPDAVAARRVLAQLGAEAGPALAFGGIAADDVRGGDSGVAAARGEWVAVIPQGDGGRSARTGLAALVTAPWLRAARVGGAGLRVTACGVDTWCVGHTGPTAVAANTEPDAVLALRDGVLVVAAGARPRGVLEGVEARRRAGIEVATEDHDGASAVLRVRGDDDAAGGALRAGYGSVRQGDAVHVEAGVAVPSWVLRLAGARVARGLR